MDQPRHYNFPRDEFRAAANREQELNDALSYLDRAISHFANQEAPSRWAESHRPPVRRGLFAPGLTQAVQRFAMFGVARRTPTRSPAAIHL
jgi:hypothetical protein